MMFSSYIILLSVLLFLSKFQSFQCLSIQNLKKQFLQTETLIKSLNNPITNNPIDELQSQSHFYSRKSFSDLTSSKYVEMVIKHLQLPKPSKIQALTYKEVLSGKSCIIADQTGIFYS